MKFHGDCVFPQDHDLRSFENFSKYSLHILSDQDLSITGKSGLIPFHLNIHQLKASREIEKQEKENRPVRLVVLKPRQIGFTTFSCGKIYEKCSTQKYKNGLIVSDTKDHAGEAFDKVKLFWNQSITRKENGDPEPYPFRPLRRRSNARELLFENPDNKTRDKEPGLLSKITIDSSFSDNPGRSLTNQYVHLSEVAYWKNFSSLFPGISEGCHDIPGTMMIVESTANGTGGDGQDFKNLWDQAEESEYWSRMFFYWFEDLRYRVHPKRVYIPQDSEKYGEERFYYLELQKIGYPEETILSQLNFRRRKIDSYISKEDDDGEGIALDPLELFKQEYPFTPEEAFRSSGQPVFNRDQLDKRAAVIRNLSHTDPPDEELDSLTTQYLRIWIPPHPEASYAVGADVAEGLAGGDFSSASIVDQNYNHCAQWHGKCDPDDFAKVLIEIAKYYNRALICWEHNNMGHTVTNELKKSDYDNLYIKQIYDKIADKWTEQLGWRQTRPAKNTMINEIIKQLRRENLKINDKRLIRQMGGLVRQPNGNVELGGKDMVVAMGLSLQGLFQVVGEEFEAIVPTRKKPSPKSSVWVTPSIEEEIAETEENENESNQYFD